MQQSRKLPQQAPPKNEGSSLKQIVVAGAAVSAVLGGAYIVYKLATAKRGSSNDDDDAFTANPEAPAAAEQQPPSPASSASGTMQSNFTREYSFRVTAENEEMIEAALREHKKELAAQAHAVQGTVEQPVRFPHLGVTFTGFAGWRGWILNEEPSPMPNMAIVTITKPEFQERNQQRGPGDMGSDPIILMTIEDISNENLTHSEFKEKSKQMAIGQMMAMTGGMYQPKFFLDDDNIDIGVFKACLEYGQSLPPYLDIRVCNLITVKNGLAYIFQLMAKPDVLNTYRKQFMDMARHIEIETFASVDFTRQAHKVVICGGYKVQIPPSWTVGMSGENVEVRTASTVKMEIGVLHPAGKVGIVASTTNAVVENVNVTTVDNGRMKIFSTDKFSLAVSPVQKATVTTDERLFAALVKSVTPTSESPSEFFVHAKDKYKFATVAGSKIVASMIGKGAVIYAPDGVPTQEELESQAEQGPTVTIRVGDPTTESDCLSTLDEWEQNFRNEDGASISNLSRTRINGFECVTVINKEMQDVGPGQRVEIMAKIFVFVKDGKTTLIRWEVSTGQFKKYERKMNQFMDSFVLL
jgi:hypothetical protein